ncbi:MAG TPA: sel1 repeat family protein, partial [Rhodospirillales bacterium]|nr:sel1 repeat family protein [Rhodospirillales bacterium]
MPPDPAEAIKWFRKGIAQDNHWAQHNLGYMYSQGYGVPQNNFKAAKWFRKAANQGNADPQSNLGAMYLTGNGVPQDFELSYIWLTVAAANGAKFALENRNIVTMNLTKDQLKKADSLLKLCQ